MKKLLFLVIVVLLLYIFRADWLSAYARLFTINNATDGSDVMIILSGNIDTRPAYGAKLYHEGYAKRVFLTREKNFNGKFSPYVDAINAYAERQLKSMDVPVEFLPSTHDEGAMSTMDEALDTVAFLKANPDIIHVTLVTDAPHTYRSWYAFQKAFEANGLGHIDLKMAAAPNAIFDENNWYTTEKGLLYYFTESIKVLMYWVNLENNPNITPT